MAEFFFVPYSAHGHVNPMLPVVARLVDSGERVRVLVGRAYAAAMTRVGAQVIRLPVDFDVHVPDGFAGVTRSLVLARRVAANWGASRLLASEFTRARPDLVVTDPMAAWAERAARRVALPTVLFSTTFATNEHVMAEWMSSRYRVTVPRPLFRLHPRVRRHRRDLVLVNSLPETQPARDSLGAEVRFVGPLLRDREPEAGDLPWPAIHSGPTLAVSPGTVFARRPAFFRAVAAAFGDTEWVVVMATGRVDPGELGPLPANVIARRTVPQLALLRHSTVFLTHGGMNSALEALASGVPMVVTPRAGDQFLVARQLVALGVGVQLDPGLAGLRATVERLATDQRVRAAVAAIRSRLTAGADTAAELLRRHVT
ncbi:nucleotide disphospho-sugar-binding domain-containing protein [Actinocrispum wychmicini]|uniref:MGT family glycosyltransferase n=1 Tax=Actinocrispum wychmicini TaxID=1213861 RepID=A0A4R2J7D0_9PSEU|nr:nucleotide disphospho-sugar-binding domain-containing protein [Actinocrispum wychmicini]TCO55003.1 MGT family glycosyltransferase [Actinocrispum wychmicini]